MDNILAIDIGGSSIKYAVFTSDFEKKEKGEVDVPNTLDGLVETIVDLRKSHAESLSGIAISMPGVINTNTGIHIHGGALRYIKNINLRKLIEEKVDIPVIIQNDAKAAILGERQFGSLKGIDNSLMLVLGTGVGGAAITGGKLLTGANNGSLEISLLKVNNEVETMETIFAMQNGLHSLLEPLKKNKGLNKLDGKQFFNFLLDGDKDATKIFNDYCDRIAIQLYNLYFILEPEKIVIGGGISAQPIVSENINLRFKERVDMVKKVYSQGMDDESQLVFEIPEVVQAKLGNDANLYGAVVYYKEKQETK